MALILTRKNQEAFSIGKDIVVRIVGIQGGQCRIMIAAPRAENIVREELLSPEDFKAIEDRASNG